MQSAYINLQEDEAGTEAQAGPSSAAGLRGSKRRPGEPAYHQLSAPGLDELVNAALGLLQQEGSGSQPKRLRASNASSQSREAAAVSSPHTSALEAKNGATGVFPGSSHHSEGLAASPQGGMPATEGGVRGAVPGGSGSGNGDRMPSSTEGLAATGQPSSDLAEVYRLDSVSERQCERQCVYAC